MPCAERCAKRSGSRLTSGICCALVKLIGSPTQQDVELLFAASSREAVDEQRLHLLDPAGSEAEDVLPPVVSALARLRDSPTAGGPHWLGNLYQPRRQRS